MIKLKDIAEEAGVALSTVSATLNGTGRVSAKRREEITALADKMGYRPNLAAKLLRDSENKILGLVVVAPPQTLPGHGVYSAVIAEMVEDCCSQGWRPHFEMFDPENSAQADVLPSMFTDGLAAGCIYGGYMSEPVRQWLDAHPGFPVVSFGEPGEYSVQSDNAKGIHDAVQYLVAAGHRRISMICGPRQYDIHHQSIQGFEKAAADFGLQLNEHSICEQHIEHLKGEEHDRENIEFLDSLFSDPGQAPDALILSGRRLNSIAFYHLQRKGIRIPEDLSIIGILADWEASGLYPGVTAVQRDFVAMTQAATRMLMQLVQGNPVRNPHTFIESKLVHRNSVRSRVTPGELATSTERGLVKRVWDKQKGMNARHK